MNSVSKCYNFETILSAIQKGRKKILGEQLLLRDFSSSFVVDR